MAKEKFERTKPHVNIGTIGVYYCHTYYDCGVICHFCDIGIV